jgi:hypothetical protein
MKLKLSILFMSSAVFCQEPKTKWVKDDIKCGRSTGVSCSEEEINKSKNIQKDIDKLMSQVSAKKNNTTDKKLKLEIEKLEKSQKCQKVSFGTEDPKIQFPNGKWVKYNRETCKMTSDPCPHQKNPELADDCIFNANVSIDQKSTPTKKKK